MTKSVIFLEIGPKTNAIGTATINPIMKLLSQINRNPSIKPIFTIVITKEIKKLIKKDMVKENIKLYNFFFIINNYKASSIIKQFYITMKCIV